MLSLSSCGFDIRADLLNRDVQIRKAERFFTMLTFHYGTSLVAAILLSFVAWAVILGKMAPASITLCISPLSPS